MYDWLVPFVFAVLGCTALYYLLNITQVDGKLALIVSFRLPFILDRLESELPSNTFIMDRFNLWGIIGVYELIGDAVWTKDEDGLHITPVEDPYANMEEFPVYVRMIDGEWYATIPALGEWTFQANGKTPEEAIRNLEEVKRSVLHRALLDRKEKGHEIGSTP